MNSDGNVRREGEGEHLWSIEEALAFLGMSDGKLRQLTKAGEIRVIKDGRWVRYDRRDLLAWCERRKAIAVG